jgi:hypothetical protein
VLILTKPKFKTLANIKKRTITKTKRIQDKEPIEKDIQNIIMSW